MGANEKLQAALGADIELIQPVLGLRPYLLLELNDQGTYDLRAGGTPMNPEGVRLLASMARTALRALRRTRRRLHREERRRE